MHQNNLLKLSLKLKKKMFEQMISSLKMNTSMNTQWNHDCFHKSKSYELVFYRDYFAVLSKNEKTNDDVTKSAGIS